jgi:hypothetical protein
MIFWKIFDFLANSWAKGQKQATNGFHLVSQRCKDQVIASKTEPVS